MAKFECNFPMIEFDDGRHGSSGGRLSGSGSLSEGLTSEDLLSILRPAAEALRDHYKTAIRRLFKQRTGDLLESIQLVEFGLDRGYLDLGEASIRVEPKGKHKKSKRGARSRAGSADKRYAKHNRDAKSTSLSNAELAYLLEFGTPRIGATHWMENTNTAVMDEIQDMVEDAFDALLKSKGLI